MKINVWMFYMFLDMLFICFDCFWKVFEVSVEATKPDILSVLASEEVKSPARSPPPKTNKTNQTKPSNTKEKHTQKTINTFVLVYFTSFC